MKGIYNEQQCKYKDKTKTKEHMCLKTRIPNMESEQVFLTGEHIQPYYSKDTCLVYRIDGNNIAMGTMQIK